MAGKKGFGTKLSYSPDGVTYTDLANVVSVKPFAPKADILDVTAHDSPSQYREKLSGLLDSGQCMFELNYDDKNTGHRWLLTNLGVEQFFKVTGPGASPGLLAFKGFVKQVEPTYPHDNKLTASCGIEITSIVTVT